MCVLTGRAIESRIGDIFTGTSWCSDSIQEASYDLRVDTEPYLQIGGKWHSERNPYESPVIIIEPGELAMLPTVESFCMPSDLVGSIKIKFSHSRKGLTPLFGPKVDPYFGKGHDGGERLYLSVSNLGLERIEIDRNEGVFNVQFHKLSGPSPVFKKKDAIGPKIAREVAKARRGQHLGFMDAMKGEVTEDLTRRIDQDKREFNGRIDGVEKGTQQVVYFGVFLVASALIASMVAAVFGMVFALTTDSEVVLLGRLQKSQLESLLFGLCGGLAAAVLVLICASVLKLICPIVGSLADRVRSIRCPDQN